MPQRIGRFTSVEARERFLKAYDIAMGMWPQPRREWDVDTAFGTVHVHRYGPAAGTPIVLLHGAGGNSSNWYPQVAALGAHHPVYAIDTIDDPTRSTQQRVVDGSADYAALLEAVVDRLDLREVHLVGFSYGGWIALNQAVYNPARLASVTLLEPGGLEKVPVAFFVTIILGAVALAAPRRIRPWLAKRLAMQALVEHQQQTKPIMLAARTYRTNRPAARPFTDDELRRIRMPVQILLAGRSTLLRPDRAATRVRELIPMAQVEIVPGAGHGLPLECPALVNQRILDFTASAKPQSNRDAI